MTENEELAPVYRYFMVDLLTNSVLQEIPYGGVTYERGLKSAGAFRGVIPVIEDTQSLEVYENTSPGNTALYIVRNGICVWGGIVWSRTYNVVAQNLTVSASEFTSYLYHRRVWKTWNHKFGATVTVLDGEASVVFDTGSTSALGAGASVRIEFRDATHFKYDGYYRIASSPAPTTDGFYMDNAESVVVVTGISRKDDVVTVRTDGAHSLNVGDEVTLLIDDVPGFTGSTQTVIAIGGGEGNLFSYAQAGIDVPVQDVEGVVTRKLPDGVYRDTTVSVRTDTYEYVRSLVGATFKDFVGIDFPNLYIEPGISYAFDITQRGVEDGLATIQTEEAHNLAVGQAVQVRNLDPQFDGEHAVLETRAENEFTYALGGYLAEEEVSPRESVITAVSAKGTTVSITTAVPHNFLVGQTVNVQTGLDFDGVGQYLNGVQTITQVPDASSFKYEKASISDIPLTELGASTITWDSETLHVTSYELTDNVARLTVAEDVVFNTSDPIVVENVTPSVQIIEKSLDAANSVATVTTDVPHEFEVGDEVSIHGIRDISNLIKKQVSVSDVVTFTTAQSHNFKSGDTVTVSDLLDVSVITHKALTSNVVSLTTSVAHNIPTGAEIVVSDLYDTFTTTTKELEDGIATLTLSSAHNFAVNDEVVISGVVDTASVVAKSAENGVAILTLSRPHNFLEQEEITVAGVGAPFDGTFTVLSFTDTRVLYEIELEGAILPAQASGTVTGTNSIFNAEATLSAVTSTTISYQRGGNDVPLLSSTSGVVTGLSGLNGVYETVASGSPTVVQYNRVGNNMASASVPVPASEEQPPPTISTPSIHLGERVLTSISRNTISFSQPGIDNAVSLVEVDGIASVPSIFNGTYTLNGVDGTLFRFAMSATSNVLETSTNSLSFVQAPDIFNGNHTIVGFDSDANSVDFARTHGDISFTPIASVGTAVVSPVAVVSSFGPYPGNADIGIGFSTRRYSGVDVEPIAYRGFEMMNVGEALDNYSDSINGFEFRIDCAFDEETETFTRTFVLIPINYPNPPAPGEVSPPSRFGADKFVFEYPGNISNLTIEESAENSATRFFAIGESDLGPGAGPPFSVASNEDLLRGRSGRKWPLLDDDEKISDINDERVLYSYARRYLSESRPPDSKLTLTVIGSLQPFVGTYNPGDWCSLIVRDSFIQQRLASGLEPRPDIIIRKIETIKVSVPEGTTFPEQVDLVLIPEWEVDKRG